MRATTLSTEPGAGKRGSASDSHFFPGFWADVDFGDIGHAHDPAAHSGLVLPADAVEARRIVDESGLPEPTLWVNSGGGLYPWWLLLEPYELTDDNRLGVAELSAGVQAALGRSAARLGYHYGTGVGDLARVLRLPGTVNRKAGLERPCMLVEDWGPKYALTDLGAAVAPSSPKRVSSYVELAPASAPHVFAMSDQPGDPSGGDSVFDHLATGVTWEQLLATAGWTRCGLRHPEHISACFTRAGEEVHSPCSAHVLQARPEVLVVWSEAAGLPTGAGQRLTKARVFAHLWHGGDERAAAADLRAAMQGRPHTQAAKSLHLAVTVERGTVGTAADEQRLTTPSKSPKDPDRYFDRKEGLLVATLAADVQTLAGPFALGPGDTLWPYRDGVYLEAGEREVREAVVTLCGERFRDAHLRNVTQVLKARHTAVRLPTGTDVPPDTYLNLLNGLLDWRQGGLHPHDPLVPSVHRIPVAWHPRASCPATDRFLRSLFGDDEAVLSFVDEVVAAVLYAGHPFHQRAIMLLGRGKNGKGAFLSWLRALVGDRNVSEVKPQALDSNRFASAQLYGKLANLAGDVAPTAFTNSERFKEITAGDVIDAERKYGQPFSFHPVATVVGSFNEMPATVDRSEGFFRRWLVLPFPYRFVGKEERTGAPDERPRDPKVSALVTTPSEMSGYLNRAVAGMQRLYERGDFAPPRNVRDATERFREHADPVVAFLSERCAVEPEGFVSRPALKGEYDSFCEGNGSRPLSAIKLYEHLPNAASAALGTAVHAHKRNGQRGFRGMRLREP